jgi:peptidoglycan LD-endopeptidase LytH
LTTTARQPVADIVRDLPHTPGARPPRSQRRRSQADLAADPLRAIPPPGYFAVLARTEVPSSGFVNCPLPDHDDPDPSCRVWNEPDRGWYCFGCRRGGDIYELAGGLWDLDRRGKTFLEIRRRLTRLFRTAEPTSGRNDPPPATEQPRPRAAAAPAPLRRDAPTGDGSAPTALVEPAAAEDKPSEPANRGETHSPPERLAADQPGPARNGHALVHAPAVDSAAAPGTASSIPLLAVIAVLLAGMGLVVAMLAVLGGMQPETGETLCAPSASARQGIPARYLALYRDTGRAYGLDWAVLAAIGLIESGHGQNLGPSSAGALGPMQFMPATWGAYGVDGNGDGRKDVMDPEDAIPGAARYLKASGAPGNWRRAIFAYNHADWYVRDVLAQAERYRADCTPAADWIRGSGRLSWPLRGPLTSPFGMRWGRLHAGIDIGAPAGRPIHAADAGRVILRGPTSGYGNYLCVQHRARLSTCYAHLSAYRTRLGRQVKRGQLIGLVGCTGRCFGDHLHFEVRRGGAWAEPVDPMPYLGARP